MTNQKPNIKIKIIINIKYIYIKGMTGMIYYYKQIKMPFHIFRVEKEN